MSKENLYSDAIRTYSGKYLDVFNPDPEMICIEDIAHSLAHQCRFGGHLPQFYSVAQHSYFVSKMVDKEYELIGLMHDASEAYLLDIPRPIKKKLPCYKAIENSLMEVIAKKFGFQYPFPMEIKEADETRLFFEWEFYMLKNDTEVLGPAWKPLEAKDSFLEVFYYLTR